MVQLQIHSKLPNTPNLSLHTGSPFNSGSPSSKSITAQKGVNDSQESPPDWGCHVEEDGSKAKQS